MNKSRLQAIYLWMLAYFNDVWWLLDKKAESVLDLGCCYGASMALLNKRKNFYSVGVDKFRPYIEYCKERKTHDKYLEIDVRELPFPDNSFDAVLCLQVLEHLPKEDGFKLIERMEGIARRQVVIAAPIGEKRQEAVDDNPWQIHRSAWVPEEFKERNYRIKKHGLKWLQGENGLINRTKIEPLRKSVFVIDMLLTPLYYLFPFVADDYLIATKNVSDNREQEAALRIRLSRISTSSLKNWR